MIQIRNLTMHYGPVVALNGISFDVNEGEIVGLLGPNGAGKSTTMKILTTYLYPTSGKAMVAGMDVTEKPVAVRKHIGYLPEVLPLYMDMEVREYLKFIGNARGITGRKLKERIEAIVEECGLRAMYRRVIRELSKGYRQRTALAQALIHEPDVIILDEPTSGLDPHQIIEIRSLIRRLAEGRTVILSTHILQEVQATADRIVIINHGRIVGDGTVEALRDDVKEYERIQVKIVGRPKEIEPLLMGCEPVKKVLVREESEEQGKPVTTFEVHGKVNTPLLAEIGRLAKERNWEIHELSEHPLSLEEVFLSLTERSRNNGKEGRI